MKIIGRAWLPLLGKLELAVPENSDRRLLEEFFSSLSEETILLRFLRPLRDFGRTIERILNPGRTVVAVVALYDSKVIGSAEIYHVKPSVGEFAIVVHDNFQRRGVGTTLTYTSFRLAKVKGLKRIIAYFHEENEAMKRLTARFQGRIVSFIDDLYMAEFDLENAVGAGEKVLAFKNIKVALSI